MGWSMVMDALPFNSCLHRRSVVNDMSEQLQCVGLSPFVAVESRNISASIPAIDTSCSGTVARAGVGALILRRMSSGRLRFSQLASHHDRVQRPLQELAIGSDATPSTRTSPSASPIILILLTLLDGKASGVKWAAHESPPHFPSTPR